MYQTDLNSIGEFLQSSKPILTVGKGDFALTEEETKFIEGVKTDTELVKKDKIKLIPRPNPIFATPVSSFHFTTSVQETQPPVDEKEQKAKEEKKAKRKSKKKTSGFEVPESLKPFLETPVLAVLGVLLAVVLYMKFKGNAPAARVEEAKGSDKSKKTNKKKTQ